MKRENGDTGIAPSEYLFLLQDYFVKKTKELDLGR